MKIQPATVSLIKTVFKNSLAFLSVLFLIRIVGFFYVDIFPNRSDILSFRGFISDISFTVRVFIVLSFFQFLINLLTKKTHTFLLWVIPPILILAELLLVEYLKTTTIMLDEALFNYSLSEVLIISGGTSSLNFFLVCAVLIFPILFLFLAKKINCNFQKLTPKKTILFVSFFLLIGLFPTVINTTNERFNQIANNNTAYFFSRIYAYFDAQQQAKNNQTELLTTADIQKIDANFFSSSKTIDPNYPFFHELPDSSQLETFLNPTTNGKAPNIVFIICESMSTYFVGDNADKTGHIMPFLDSLATQSLYFPNFLSVCDRTYHALPASMASIPIIPSGKIFHEMEHTNYFSLPNLLEKDYFSRFYCGTYLSFTQMDNFMNNNNINYLVKDWETSFSADINGVPNPWGYQEKELFLKSWYDYDKQKLANKPRLDIFLTVSTHPPYKLKEKEKYLDKTRRLMVANGKSKKIDYKRTMDSFLDAYSTFTYLDDQLKTYFEQAKNYPDYENTIFIIYGDHGTAIASVDDISEYRIPLLIFSPLLKQPQKFLGVNSQLDLAPTLINYLRKNYLSRLPSQTTFAGKELSFSKHYKNDRTLLLGTYLRNQDYYLNQNYYVRNGQLYQVSDNLAVQKIDNSTVLANMETAKEYAKKVVNYSVYNDKFGPKSFIHKYIKLFQIKPITNTSISGELKTEKGNPFVGLGDYLILEPTIQQLMVKFKVECLPAKVAIFSDIPKLTMSLHDEKTDEMLYWTQVDFFQEKTLTKGTWNSLTGNKSINIKEILKGKKLPKRLVLRYYLYNNELNEYRFKNAKVEFFRKEFQ
ncbi:MAG TPA: sulfatase-like hydrolase/transferase [Crocinitomicaceae bacterium]|nr:sulfatase-like hydrolase/transferase [Crocinitomicaceae bacterium]